MKRDIFSTPVSVYAGKDFAHLTHHVRPIGAFLGAHTHYAEHFERLRSVYDAALACYDADPARSAALLKEYKRHKSAVPMCMPAGICPDHTDNGFSEYSDIICLDIDAAKPGEPANGNEWVQDWGRLKKDLGRLPWVAYCGFSASGHGLFLLIPIESHNAHAAHWRALRRLFKTHLHITIDPATKNIGRLRFMGADDEPIINHSAEVFTLADREEPEPVRSVGRPHLFADDTEQKIAKCASIIETRHTDITQNYDDWLKAAAAIAHHMGERGRELFHTIASQSPKYKHRENEKLYTNLMRGAATQCSIATFFWLCEQNGIDIGKAAPRPLPVPRANSERTPRKANRSGNEAAHTLRRICKKKPYIYTSLVQPLGLWPDGMTEKEFDAFMRR